MQEDGESASERARSRREKELRESADLCKIFELRQYIFFVLSNFQPIGIHESNKRSVDLSYT